MGERGKPAGLFGALFELLQLASQLSDEKQAIYREGKFGKNGVAGHWSVNVRLGVDGERVRNPGAEGAVHGQNSGAITTLPVPKFEVHDEGEILRVIITDLPGRTESVHNVSIMRNVLIYDAPEHDVRAECLLPCEVEREPLNKTYNFGLLMVELKKVGRNPDEQ